MDSRQRRRAGWRRCRRRGGQHWLVWPRDRSKHYWRVLARVLCDPCSVRQFSKIERVLLMTKAARLELQVQGERAGGAGLGRTRGQPSPHAFQTGGNFDRADLGGATATSEKTDPGWLAEGRVGKLIDSDQGMADSPARWRFCRAHASIHPASGRYTAAGHRYPPGVFCYTRHPMYTVGNRVNYECCTRMHAVPRPLTGLQ